MMVLDEQDLRRGLKFLVGTWQADFIVNAFSDDLAHIPAAEFKSEDGQDFSAVTFTFFEDHTAQIATDKATHKAAWEQTDLSEYRCTPEALAEASDPVSRAAQTLTVQDGALVFMLGFLAVGLKKTAEGAVTEAPGVGDLPGDETAQAIVGRYAVAKAMAMVGESFDLFPRAAVEADLNARIAAGEADPDEAREQLQSFDSVVEFTPDHRVITWMKLPEGVGEAEIAQALAAGEISQVKDGFFAAGEQEWKAVDGVYYYNTGEKRELFGEEQSPWDPLTPDADGLIPFGGGMMMLKKL